MDYNLGYVNVEDRVFGKPPIGCVLDLAGRPFSGDKIKDNSPYGNNGTITGATWIRNESKLWVLNFDGTDDKITLDDTATGSPLNFQASDFTLEVWVKFDDFVGIQVIWSKGSHTAGTGVYYFDMRNSTQLFVTIDKVTTGLVSETFSNFFVAGDVSNWLYIALVKAGATLTAYKNLVATVGTQTFGTIPSNTVSTKLGIYGDGTLNPFDGQMALARAHNTALSAFIVNKHFNQERHLFGV